MPVWGYKSGQPKVTEIYMSGAQSQSSEEDLLQPMHFWSLQMFTLMTKNLSENIQHPQVWLYL